MKNTSHRVCAYWTLSRCPFLWNSGIYASVCSQVTNTKDVMSFLAAQVLARSLSYRSDSPSNVQHFPNLDWSQIIGFILYLEFKQIKTLYKNWKLCDFWKLQICLVSTPGWLISNALSVVTHSEKIQGTSQPKPVGKMFISAGTWFCFLRNVVT